MDPRPAAAERTGQRPDRLGLEQGLTPGQTHEAMRRQIEGLGRRDQLAEGDRVARLAEAPASPLDLETGNLAGTPGLRRVAPGAAQVTPAQPHEESRLAHVRPLSLHGGEDLDDVRAARNGARGLPDVRRALHRQPSRIERPIATSATSASRRSGRVGRSCTSKRATWSSSRKALIHSCFEARWLTIAPRSMP